MKPWSLQKFGEGLRLIVDKKNLGTVRDLRGSSTTGFVKVSLEDRSKQKLALEEFSSDDGERISSRIVFLETWGKFVKKDSLADCSGDSDEQDTSVSFDDLSTPADEVPKKAVAGLQDRITQDYFVGTFDVHIQNLKAPEGSRATRLLDHEHISSLCDSFKETMCGQFVLLIGMISSLVDFTRLKDSLINEGEISVEILGGNHTREALQDLYRKGLLTNKNVKVQIYKPMPRSAALALGYQHNRILHEKKKPMSLLDKLRLMRATREENQTPLEWKDMLTVVFHAKDRRTFQQMYSYHMLLAQLPEALWLMVVEALERMHVTEKFFRKMMRLDDDGLIKECLETLLTGGKAKFHEKVNTFIEQGHVRSGKKRTVRKDLNERFEAVEETSPDVDIVTGEETVSADQDDLGARLLETERKYRELKDRYNSLLEENNELKEQLQEVKASKAGKENKRKGNRDNVLQPVRKTRKDTLFRKGDCVMACYCDVDGEQWLKAAITDVTSSGLFKVVYDVDGFQETLEESKLKPL